MRREDRRPEFFPFFPGRWLASHRVLSMSPEQRGCFIQLLSIAWQDESCSIPNDERIIAQMCGVGKRWRHVREAILGVFPEHPTLPGRRANTTQLNERRIAEEHMQQRSDVRRAAAKKRWGNANGSMQEHAEGNAHAMQVHSNCNAPSRGTERNGTERNGTESAARARTRETPAAAAAPAFTPEVENLAASIEASLPPGDRRRGSAQRRADLARLCADLGTERVRRAIEGLLAFAPSAPELDSIRGRLAGFVDSLAGDHGRNRIEQIERALPKPRCDDGLIYGMSDEDREFDRVMREWGWQEGDELPGWALNWKPGDPVPPREEAADGDGDAPDDDEEHLL